MTYSHKDIKHLLKRRIVKMLEDELHHNSSTKCLPSGATIINIKQNDSFYLLLYYLLNDLYNTDEDFSHTENNHELNELIQKVDTLLMNNRKLQQEIAQYTDITSE